MSSGSSKPGIRTPDPTASLPDDVLVDILSRLPVKSLCRCKAVWRRWRSLIAHDDHRRTLARTLPGLFYGTRDSKRSPAEARHFTHVWEGDRRPLVPPSLSFLPAYCEDITVLGCVNGVLLCRFSETDSQDDNFRFRYVVCNPVDKRRVVLPDSGCGAKNRVAFLAFDPSLYPDVHMFEFVMDEEDNPSWTSIRTKLGLGVTSKVVGILKLPAYFVTLDACFSMVFCILSLLLGVKY